MINITRLMSRILVVSLFIIAAIYANALVPLGPSTLTVGQSSTQSPGNYPAANITAYAGNITRIDIYGISQTKHWQGYYGDVTGTIVLDDANNYTLYDWPQAEPKGEIYATASNTTPTWSSMSCFNMSINFTGSGTLTEWESFYNMTFNDVDGINETFNMTTHPAIDIGDVITILTNTCPSTFMHVNDTFQTDKFVEVLLSDPSGRLVFTTILENDDTGNNTDYQGYQGTPFTPDFQMLVAEDGTSRVANQINTATTPYYFYVDLQ